ncbi:hypothetical protein [Planctopirus hydrillae]|uniref:Methylated-DNA-[protein]-cysteine S-methyltransferase DNA binding domain-containing protein n=1 Tax=Planctopirus hydrillae TaxID=1841610 RepID=A0A1C3ECW2_9PLAN|nr:hypothetical protein [Planctopirus hydrillae]ODA31050.1 hypothetical protein A6X21_22935 [Planctopirus hydrillae]
MASTRADALAEVIFSLKRADKLATHNEAAAKCGFKPGAGSKALLTALNAVRRDWPHLQWYRIVGNEGNVPAESEQAGLLEGAGVELAPSPSNPAELIIVDQERWLSTTVTATVS